MQLRKLSVETQFASLAKFWASLMIFENIRYDMPADDSHEISCLISYV